MGSHFTNRALTIIFGVVSRQGSATDKKTNRTRVRCPGCEVVGAKQNYILNVRYEIFISQMAIVLFLLHRYIFPYIEYSRIGVVV
jgi:hypothetical protein